MASTAPTLPHWDMTVVYPSLRSPEFEEGFGSLVQNINGLADLFDTYQIGHREPTPLDGDSVQAFEKIIGRFNAVLDETRTVNAYINGFVATDSRDNLAQAKLSELHQHLVRLTQLGTRLTAWVGALDVEGLIERSQ